MGKGYHGGNGRPDGRKRRRGGKIGNGYHGGNSSFHAGGERRRGGKMAKGYRAGNSTSDGRSETGRSDEGGKEQLGDTNDHRIGNQRDHGDEEETGHLARNNSGEGVRRRRSVEDLMVGGNSSLRVHGDDGSIGNGNPGGRRDKISRAGKGDRGRKVKGLKDRNGTLTADGDDPTGASNGRENGAKKQHKPKDTVVGRKHARKNKGVRAGRVSLGELDWSRLDALLDWMQARGLALGFELMGNPAGLFSDLSRPDEARAWRRFVAQLLRRYLDRYGSEAIARWRFETWNEPDLRKYNTLNFTLPGFVRYARASAAGLRAGALGLAEEAPALAGPAGLFKRPRARHPLCWGLLRRCARRPGACPIAQLSFHRKGGGAAGGYADGVVRGGAQLLRTLRRKFPQLATLPVANTEADPESGWWRPEAWRADARYAAMVARVAAESQRRLVHQLGARLVASSNDDAFLNDAPHPFAQRTLLARFQVNGTRLRPGHSQFVGKPALAALGLMGLLGERELAARARGFGGRAARRHLAVLAAAGGEQEKEEGARAEAEAFHAAVLLAWGGGADPAPADWANVTVALRGLPKGARVAVWQVDDQTDPHAVWAAAGSPEEPGEALRAAMRAAAGPRLATPPTAARGGKGGGGRPTRVAVSLPPPAGVALVQACARPAAPPGAPTRLLALNVTAGEALLLWSDERVGHRCLLEYEVQFRNREGGGGSGGGGGDGDWRRVSPPTLRLLSFHFAPSSTPASAASDPASALSADQAVRGDYRVRAVDFWGRPGNFSELLAYG